MRVSWSGAPVGARVRQRWVHYDNAELSEQIHRWAATGFTKMKIKIGEGRGSAVERDLGRTALARELAGEAAELYVDANGAYSAAQAIRVGGRLDELGVTWFEEPVSSDDPDGLRRVREAVTADVTAGEYGYHLLDFVALMPVVDCLQVDVTRCGGYGEWLRVAALAAARNLEVSGVTARPPDMPESWEGWEDSRSRRIASATTSVTCKRSTPSSATSVPRCMAISVTDASTSAAHSG